MVDEPFMDFVVKTETVVPEVLNNPALVVVGSLTKFFALPGLRLGYLAAARSIRNKVSRHLPPWQVNLLAQMAGEASLEDRSYIENTLKIVYREKDFLYQRLQAIPGLLPYPPRANSIFGRLPEQRQNGGRDK